MISEPLAILNFGDFGISNRCRNCKHIHWASNTSQSTIIMQIWECTYKESALKCLCKNFAPFYNLEYLEWLHDKKT